MSKNVFVSFKYGEENWKDNGLQFFQAYKGKAQATPVFIGDNEIPQPTNAKIEDAITAKLARSVGLLVVIGNSAQHSEWVTYEVGKALAMGKKCAYTRHPGA